MAGVAGSWDELNRPPDQSSNQSSSSAPGSTVVANPADLGPWRGAVQRRGQTYDTRGDEQYDWAKDQFAKNAGTAGTVQTRALDTGANFADYAKRDRALYDRRYVPAMEQQLDYAQQYTTPERMAANRAQAITSGSLAANAIRAASERNLQSIGIDPSSGRYAGLEAGLAARQAANNAGLATKSDRDTEMMGQQLLANAIKTGQVLPGQAVNQAGVSLAADKEAIDTGLATTASGAQTIGTGLQWSQRGDQALESWKDSLLAQTKLGMQQNQQNFENQMKQAEMDAKSASGAGAMMGAGAGILGQLGSSSGGGGGIMNMFGSMGGGGGGLGGAGGGSLGLPSVAVRKGGLIRAARGGVVPKQQPVKKFALGGFSGFSGPDVKPISMGEGQQAFDPYDPGASIWGQFDSDNPEFEDSEAEGVGRGVGGTAGGLIGSIWGPIGSMAGREIGQKAGAGVGAITQGDWGGAAESLVEGTPLDFIFQRGGAVHDDDDDENGNGEGPLTEEEMEELEELRAMERSRQNDESSDEYAGGGRVRQRLARIKQMRAGGAVRDVPEPEDIEDEDEARRNLEHRGYRPGRERDPQTGEKMAKPQAWREPHKDMSFEIPDDDTGQMEINPNDPDMSIQDQDERNRRRWVPNYQTGGTIGGTLRDTWGANAYADGGDVEDPTMVDAEELAAAGNGGGDVPNMVPPEASPSGGQETDDVHAMLNEGEFVIPKQVVSWHGEKFFQNLIKKAYNEMQQPQVAEPEAGPPQAMAISPPTFASQGG